MGSFGDRLKKEREQRSITLDDISLTTKIGTRMLRALEEEKFDQLPGGIFNKGFVRAYARHVGLDEEQTLADYMEALGESQMPASPEAHVAAKPEPTPESRPVAHAGAGSPASEIPWGMLALLLMLVVLAFASWSYYHRPPQIEKSTNAPAPTGETSVPAGSTPSPAPTPQSTAPSLERTAPASNDGKAPSTPIPTTEKTAPSSPVSQAALHGSQAIPPGASGTFTVLLKGNNDAEPCWVSIVADGQPPVEVTLVAPEQKVVQARNEIVVKAGSMGAIDVFFNGERLPRMGDYGVVRTLTFHADGLQAPPLKPVTAAPQ
jgi:cytoskeleton protein RodZ